MSHTVAIIAPGEMGSAVGRRLREEGAAVVASREGRSVQSIARAERAGLLLRERDADLVEDADILLSIVPPGAAVGLAERLAPLIVPARRKPLYVDCNAVAPETARRIAAILAPTGCRYADGGIIGPPPSAEGRTVLYVSGEAAQAVARLGCRGFLVRVIEGPIGAASALKMSYAGITKGLTAIGAAMMLAASRAGSDAALRQELGESQPHLLAWLSRQVPGMYPKAYRWVAEMAEIAAFTLPDDAAQRIYQGAARFYERLAQRPEAEPELAALTAFCRPKDG